MNGYQQTALYNSSASMLPNITLPVLTHHLFTAGVSSTSVFLNTISGPYLHVMNADMVRNLNPLGPDILHTSPGLFGKSCMHFFVTRHDLPRIQARLIAKWRSRLSVVEIHVRYFGQRMPLHISSQQGCPS